MLRKDYSLECYGDRYNEYLPFAWILLLGFALLVPFSLSGFLFYHRHELHTPITRAKIGFLYKRFRVGSEFWEIHELVRKMILTGLLIYLPPSVRPPSAIVVSLIACCTLNYYQAHKNKIVFWIAEASFVLTTGKYLVAVYGMSLGSGIGPEERKYLGYLLIGLDMSIIIGGWACVVAVFFLMRKSLELIKREEEEKRRRLTLSNRVRPMGREISIIKQLTKKKR